MFLVTNSQKLRFIYGRNGYYSSFISKHQTIYKENIKKSLQEISKNLGIIKNTMFSPPKKEQYEILRKEAQKDTLWDNSEYATHIIRQITHYDNLDKDYNYLRKEFEDLQELFEIACQDKDDNFIEECGKNISKIENKVLKIRKQILLSSPIDQSSCFLEIQAGAGGTESCDWVQMLTRMYLRWGRKQNYKTSLVEHSPGEEAGYRNATIRFDGNFAYGYCKYESGVHRIVRISPFDSKNRRHTSFAKVVVYPHTAFIPGVKKVEIKPEDLRIDTFRSSGAGGQHVNTTDSAVRITHLPTKIVVQCQNERSQHSNKAEAMGMLQGKLQQQVIEKNKENKRSYAEGLGENAWGNQIRSYVLHPYQQIKDHRTDALTVDVKSFLDGDIQSFIEEAMVHDKKD